MYTCHFFFFVFVAYWLFDATQSILKLATHSGVTTAGSRFYENGAFEVQKSEADAHSRDPARRYSALKVKIPTQLEGRAYIQVIIKTQPGMGSVARGALMHIRAYTHMYIQSFICISVCVKPVAVSTT